MIPRTRLTALALILLLCRTVGADSVSERLDRGASEFAYKNFENAAGIIEKLLYPTLQLTAEEDIVKAREMLGLCYFYLGQEDKARKEFTALLYLRPGHRLDPAPGGGVFRSHPQRSAYEGSSGEDRERAPGGD